MAHRSDQRRERHDEGTGADGGFQLHAEERGEYDQHHHAAARADKARAEADRDAADDGQEYTLPPEPRALFHRILPRSVRLDQKADTDTEGQDQGEATEHGVPDQKGDITAGDAHGQDAGHDEPAALEVNILVLGVGGGGHGGAEDIRRERDRRCLIRACLTRKRGTQHDQHGHHHRRGRKPRKPRADARADRRDHIPYPFHSVFLHYQFIQPENIRLFSCANRDRCGAVTKAIRFEFTNKQQILPFYYATYLRT